jgi:hypothetical protein
MEYTHNKYCDMLLTRSTFKSHAGTAAQEYILRDPGQPHPEINVYW